jgi:glycine dehydrogenase
MTDGRRSLVELEMRGDFIRRHIGPGDPQITEMLQDLDLESLEDLVERAVPSSIVSDQPLDLPEAKSERAALSYLRRMADRNQVFVSMIGMGYHGTVTPTVIQRNVLENPSWYTAYTPYQAEVSQGRLEALLNFQQMVMDLTAMDLANASLLDEATAAAEAMAMAARASKSKSKVFFVDQDCHPQTLAVVRTRAGSLGLEVMVGDPYDGLGEVEAFGVLVQYPGSSGAVRDLRGVVEQAHGQGALVTVAADLLSLVLLTPPGEMGADIVVGSAQRFGVPMGYGGPHAAFFATREAFKRSTPGRLIGVSQDSQGRPALRAAHPAREGDQQHLHRPSAAGRDRGVLRGLPRARRPQVDRRTGPPHDPDPGDRLETARLPGGDRGLLRYHHGPGARPGRADRRPGPGIPDQPARGRRRPPGHLPGRDHEAREPQHPVAGLRHQGR